MVLQVSSPNNVKVYGITSTTRSAIPDWLAAKKKDELKRDPEWRNRVELIQDFEFPEASTRVKITPDGKHILATGVYKPMLRVYELADLAMKFERHSDAENVQFIVLSEDWTKSVLLQSDRSLEFHTQFGIHYKTRVPKFGRDLAFHYPSSELIVGGACPDLWRLNLEQGRFLNPIITSCPNINTVSVSPAHSLTAAGGDDGRIEFWASHNTKSRVAELDVAKVLNSMSASSNVILESFPEISQVTFHENGLLMGVGTSSGHVLLYDLRNRMPVAWKDHQYGFPIKNVSFHSSGNVVSSDTKTLKIWNQYDTKLYTSIEPTHDINDVCVIDNSGLILVANEGVQILSYYIPSLGPAPRWCPFLENLTEELEENPNQTLYDDYKFITRKELNRLGLDHLIGTNVLRAYMHGFFVDLRLYEKARAIANPFELDIYRKNKVQARIDKDRETRIRDIKKLPKVNKELAKQLLADTKAATSTSNSDVTMNGRAKKKAAKNNEVSATPLSDDRFKAMFEDEDYEVDQTALEYKLLHPTTKKRHQREEEQEDEDDDAALEGGNADLEEEEEREGHGSDVSSDDDDEDGEDSEGEYDNRRYNNQRTKPPPTQTITPSTTPFQKPNYKDRNNNNNTNSHNDGGNQRYNNNSAPYQQPTLRDMVHTKARHSNNYIRDNTTSSFSTGSKSITFDMPAKPRRGDKRGGGRDFDDFDNNDGGRGGRSGARGGRGRGASRGGYNSKFGDSMSGGRDMPGGDGEGGEERKKQRRGVRELQFKSLPARGGGGRIHRR
ncbi:hypothetical protein SmJEL517_g02622 [Synchytrium microbalum]|uniref:Uncharacterized protein n=1 Tax=Synchytrium microbalum TaxID=1806994 RepID=A0A507C708_9FUNG|nr:uncharacterized protein SmJEL517_g02622 [Synchytrium microbalum]TPX34909.1 hypothetical protein SmJEL517_g02622 [Synchytrium microbalum]